jgi:hypothetical protein
VDHTSTCYYSTKTLSAIRNIDINIYHNSANIFLSYLQSCWHTPLSHISLTLQFLSLKQTSLQNLPSQTWRSGHWALLVQVVGWRTQPTTGVGLGMKAGGQEHCARWFTTWHAAFGPHASPMHGSTHLDKNRIVNC